MTTRRTTASLSSDTAQTDRRVRKTTASLREALHSLVIEKPYDEISVKELLDRANVGRSTFYTHFHDKDELLASTIADIIQAARSVAAPRSGNWYERILWFSLPIFEYHERIRVSASSPFPRYAQAALHDHLRKALVDLISVALQAEMHEGRWAQRRIPATLVVEFTATTFVLVFEWWLQQDQQPSAKDANRLFRSLALPSLATAD